MICNELVSNQRRRNNGSVHSIDFGKYYRLPEERRKLIYDWFKRACDELRSGEDNCFEAFMFTWIAFNGWAACISGIDGDIAIIRALIQYEPLGTKFTELFGSDQNFKSYATQFSRLWPIFEVKSARHVHYDHDAVRAEIINEYLIQKAIVYSPPCWERHKKESSDIPIDWPHTLSALYRVRCNLFHGEKALSSENDKQIVLCALYTLVYFLQGSHYLE